MGAFFRGRRRQIRRTAEGGCCPGALRRAVSAVCFVLLLLKKGSSLVGGGFSTLLEEAVAWRFVASGELCVLVGGRVGVGGVGGVGRTHSVCCLVRWVSTPPPHTHPTHTPPPPPTPVHPTPTPTPTTNHPHSTLQPDPHPHAACRPTLEEAYVLQQEGAQLPCDEDLYQALSRWVEKRSTGAVGGQQVGRGESSKDRGVERPNWRCCNTLLLFFHAATMWRQHRTGRTRLTHLHAHAHCTDPAALPERPLFN